MPLVYFSRIAQRLSRQIPIFFSPETRPSRTRELSSRQTIAICVIIFSAAVGVRLLHWQDARYMFVFANISPDYRANSQLILEGNLSLFLRGPAPPGDANILMHPPGYPLVMATLFRLFGNDDSVVRLFQIVCDAASVALLFLIAVELLPAAVAIIAAMLAALSPQLASYSIELLPDSPSVLPILLAIYCLVRASKRPSLILIIMAGAFLGLSCWLRPNALMLTFFVAALIPFLFERGKRMRYALALMGATVLVIAPITIRNIIVFRHFVPLTVGAGHNLLVGMADYDENDRFKLPESDGGEMEMEVEMYGRPDYASSLFAPDGIKRERDRLTRGLAIIRSHPIWFLGVMFRRAAYMLRYERVRLIAEEPTITHPPEATSGMEPVLRLSPIENKTQGTIGSEQAIVSLTLDGQRLRITGDDSLWGNQFISSPINVRENTDYLLKLPVIVEQGRSQIRVAQANSDAILGSTSVSSSSEPLAQEEQSPTIIEIPFVSRGADQVRIAVGNDDPHDVRPITQVGEIELFMLGPARYVWTRYPRLVVRPLQKIFTTAWLLPLTIIGILVLLWKREGRLLVILLAVPAYYLCVQVALHTEFRYVLAIHYFHFVMVAVALHWIGGNVRQSFHKLTGRTRLFSRIRSSTKPEALSSH
jgi:Dolichyl-phosphate-mannose-protein mannosyltransferase